MKKNLLFFLTFLFFLPLYSQHPGGVSAGGSLEFWFDAQQLSLSNLDSVSSWTDVANGNNATSIADSVRPTFRTNQIHGKSIVDFAGESFLSTGAIPNLNTTTITHFSVFDGSSPDHFGVIFGGSYTPDGFFSMTYRSGSQLISRVNDNAFPFAGNSSISVFNEPRYQMYNGIYDGGAATYSSYHDGLFLQTNLNAAASPGINNYYRIGSITSGSTTGLLTGAIGDIFAYSSILDTAERLIVENYLGAKYNIAIPIDMFAHQAIHSFDVVGIGQEADGNNLSARGSSNLTLSGAGLVNGDYVFAGHDNGGYALNTSDVPGTVQNRYEQIWRADFTNYSGLVDVSFDVTEFAIGAAAGYVLLTDADGTFLNATITTGMESGGVVTFTNIDLTSLSYFTLGNTSTDIVTIVANGNWNDPTSWSCNCIPTMGSVISILSGHQIDVDGNNALVQDLTIDIGGTLSFLGTSDTLFVSGNFTNNGTFDGGTVDATVYFDGAAAQDISGTATFNNLTLDNPSALTNSGTVSIKTWLHVIDGTFNTGGATTMLSSDIGTAGIRNPTTGSISGDLIVQRYIDELNNWYLLASPLIDADFEDWNQETEMQGFTGTEWPLGVSSVYSYNETALTSDIADGYTAPSSSADFVTNGVGWDIYIDDDGITTGPRTLDLTGTTSLGDGIILDGTNSSELADQDDNGWNLLGNPYAAPVTWGDVAKTNIAAGYRKNRNGAFIMLNSGDVISSGEAFWVQIDPDFPTGSVTFDANDVVSSISDPYNLRLSKSSFTEGNATYFKLKLIFDATKEDEVQIGFAADATDVLDIGMDGIKLNSSSLDDPNLSVEILNRNYARNIFNEEVNNLEIPLNIFTATPSGVSDSYDLVFEGMGDLLTSNKHFQLEDRTLGFFYDILGDTLFSANMMDNVTSTRFFLHVKEPIDVISAADVTCSAAENGKIIVEGKGSGPHTYIWRDAAGVVIKTSSNHTGLDSLTALSGGKYSLEVQNNGIFGNNLYEFVIEEPLAVVSAFSSNEDNNIFNWTYSKANDTLQVEINNPVSFYNESINAGLFSWDFGDLTFSALASSSKTYTVAGVYKVELTSSNSNSACDVVSEQYIKVNLPLGVDEAGILSGINVRVVENEILVSLNNENSQNVHFSIVNSLGKQVFSKGVNAKVNHKETITLDVAQGVYLVTVTNARSTKTKKIVLSKK